MRSIDVCHPNDAACTRTSCVPGCSRGLRRVLAAGVWAPCGTTRERSVSRRPLPLRRVCLFACVACREFHPAVATTGLFDPRRNEETVPLTPLSRLPRRPTPWAFALGTRRARVRTSTPVGRIVRGEPRPPGPCSRERARCVTTRGAFHRRGALPRIRWLVSPFEDSPRSHDPRSCPLELLHEPTDDALTSPWDFPDPAPWFHDAVRFSYVPSRGVRTPPDDTLRYRPTKPAPC
jgi:hypothetical protein